MSERLTIVTRFKHKTSYPGFAPSEFVAVREFTVTVEAEGFRTERAAIERADEATAAAIAAVNAVPQSGAVRRG